MIEEPPVRDRLLRMIADEIVLDPGSDVTAETDLLLGGLVDSLGVVRIVGWIEDELGVEVDPLDVVLENFQTVAAMVAYIDRRTS